MRFDKETAKAAGAKSSRRGKPNRATGQLRETIAALLESNVEQIERDLANMEPAARVNAWLKLAEFVVPKLTRTQTELSGPNGERIETIIRFVDDSKDEEILREIDGAANR